MKKELYGKWKAIPARKCLQAGERIDQETMFHFMANAKSQSEGKANQIQIDEVADAINGRPIYDTIFQEHQYAPWIYVGQCYEGETTNRNPLLMPMIYVCSRYRAYSRQELRMNIEIAKETCEQIARGGGIPIAPHLYFPRFMSDVLPSERYFGMEAGKRLMEQCATFYVITVDGVISEGMQGEIEYMTEQLLLKGSEIKYTQKEAEQIVERRMER